MRAVEQDANGDANQKADKRLPSRAPCAPLFSSFIAREFDAACSLACSLGVFKAHQ
ncbi:hypothetical protein [Campylobacter rectus]|uniref:hypothetical protein n=1 Tax=Campylobacter rectus TaxID=203 RepID=UPI0028E58E52|nr:hypothetical protein [Campylobacter rectus]